MYNNNLEQLMIENNIDPDSYNERCNYGYYDPSKGYPLYMESYGLSICDNYYQSSLRVDLKDHISALINDKPMLDEFKKFLATVESHEKISKLSWGRGNYKYKEDDTYFVLRRSKEGIVLKLRDSKNSKAYKVTTVQELTSILDKLISKRVKSRVYAAKKKKEKFVSNSTIMIRPLLQLMEREGIKPYFSATSKDTFSFNVGSSSCSIEITQHNKLNIKVNNSYHTTASLAAPNNEAIKSVETIIRKLKDLDAYLKTLPYKSDY